MEDLVVEVHVAVVQGGDLPASTESRDLEHWAQRTLV